MSQPLPSTTTVATVILGTAMAPSNGRSRSPGRRAAPVSVEEDVKAAHALREAYAPPYQSNFRVSAVLRFQRQDGSQGVIEAVNAEPHDANIRGAICAERAALCTFQKTEAQHGAKITRVVCATDCKDPIYPGPLCAPDAEIVATGAEGAWVSQPLRNLLMLPSVYRGRSQKDAQTLAEELAPKVAPPEKDTFAKAYKEALALAQEQKGQTVVYPLVFAAAVCFADGEIAVASELKGIEYGCTVDAVSLLIPAMQRKRRSAVVPTVPWGWEDVISSNVLVDFDGSKICEFPV
eukprot:Skav221683  [mRNA]  locus=scaffold1494:121204:127671:+ [translate_table: standard]